MRFKIVLEVDASVAGNVLPISYQYELSAGINKLLTANQEDYLGWLSKNGLTPESNQRMKVYSVSNLYIPHIYVENDRLFINVPRVQFWLSFLPEIETSEFVRRSFEGQTLLLGDRVSRVLFRVAEVSEVAPVTYKETMEYQTLSPLVVTAIRPNRTIEYLHPHNYYFGRFMFDDLVDRYELYYGHPFMGSREYNFQLLARERRKAITVHAFTPRMQKVVGYMCKFRIVMDPELQAFAYNVGFGNRINFGFGYVETLDKQPDTPEHVEYNAES